MLAEELPVLVRYKLAIEQDIAGLRHVKPAQQFRKRCLSAAVPARQEDKLSGVKSQVYGAEREALRLVLAVVGVCDASKFKSPPFTIRRNVVDHDRLLVSGQRYPKLL